MPPINLIISKILTDLKLFSDSPLLLEKQPSFLECKEFSKQSVVIRCAIVLSFFLCLQAIGMLLSLLVRN